jgi:hypothetical protein
VTSVGGAVCDRGEMPVQQTKTPRRGVPPPVPARRWWIVCAVVAVSGTIAAALLPMPWAALAGALAALGAVGAFALFVVISILEDQDH